MLSMEVAQELKTAGLKWEPALHDFFAVPKTALSERLFVISDLMADIGVLHGWPAITFNGAVEWALDYVLTMDALWIPTETQLREMVTARVDAEAGVMLQFSDGEYALSFSRDGARETVTAASGTDAYGRALLALLAPVDGAAA